MTVKDDCDDLSFTQLIESHAKQLTSLQTQLCATHVRVVHKLELQIQALQKENRELRSKGHTQIDSEIHIDDSILLGDVLGMEGCAPQTFVAPSSSELPSAWSSEPLGDQKLSMDNGAAHVKSSIGETCAPKEAAEPAPSGFLIDPAPLLNFENKLSGSVPKDMDENTSERRTLEDSVGKKRPPEKKQSLLSLPSVVDDGEVQQPSPPDKKQSLLSLRSKAADGEVDQQPKQRPSRGSVTFSAIAPEIESFIQSESEQAGSSCSSDDYSSRASDDDDDEDEKEEEEPTVRPKILHRLSSHQETLLEVASVWLNTRQRILSRSVTSSNMGASDESRQLTVVFGSRSSTHSNLTSTSHITTVLLHPGSKVAYVWEVVGLILLLYDLVVVPLDFLKAGETQFTVAMSWTICIFWTLNVGVSFCKGYIDQDGSVIFDRTSIVHRYMQTWMFPDLLAVFFSWADLIVNDRGDGGVLLWVSQFRMIRLLRLACAPALLGLTFEHVRSDRGVLVIGILQIVTLIVSFAHFIACFWYGVGSSNSQGWVEQEAMDAKPLPDRYIRSFYWALAAFVGEITYDSPNLAEQGYTAGVILLSFLISTSFVSSLTTSMTQLQIVSSQQSRNMSSLRCYLTENGVSRDLAVKLMRNAQHALNEKNRRVQESSIELLHAISEPLLAELHFELRGRHLSVHPLLRDYNFVNVSGLRKVCHIACQFFTFAMGDTVFHEFEVPANPRMLFLIEGTLIYRSNKDTEQVSMLPGQWASEAAIWLATWTYMGTMTANYEAQVMALDSMRFQRAVHTYPSAHLQVYARYFSDNVKRLFEQRLLTDLCADETEIEKMVDDAFKVAEDDVLLTRFNEERSSIRSARASGGRSSGGRTSKEEPSDLQKRGSLLSGLSAQAETIRTSLRTSVHSRGSLRSTSRGQRNSRTRRSIASVNRRPSMMVAVKQWL